MDRCLSRSLSLISLSRLLCCLLAVGLLVPLRPLAVKAETATPSDALTPEDEEYYTDWSDFLDQYGENDDLTSIVAGLYMLLAGDTSVLGPDYAASPSNALEDGAVDSGNVYVMDSPEAQADSENNLTNVVLYHVSFGGDDYDLYLSSDYVDNLYIDGSNRLWNVSSNSISGRLFPSGFSPTDTTGRILTLGPCLGNNFSGNRNYGSPNYVRRYYWSGNSLTYDTTYGVVIVDEYTPPIRASDLLLIVQIILLVAVFVFLMRRL